MPVSRTESTTVRLSEPTRAETLAAALELQRVGDGPNRWVVHVLGVHTDGRDYWVQVAPRADGTQSIVLRLSTRATARHALATLAALPWPFSGYAPVVPVMCTV